MYIGNMTKSETYFIPSFTPNNGDIKQKKMLRLWTIIKMMEYFVMKPIIIIHTLLFHRQIARIFFSFQAADTQIQ